MSGLRKVLDDLWVGAAVPAISYLAMGAATILVVVVGVKLLGLDPSDLEQLWPD